MIVYDRGASSTLADRVGLYHGCNRINKMPWSSYYQDDLPHKTGLLSPSMFPSVRDYFFSLFFVSGKKRESRAKTTKKGLTLRLNPLVRVARFELAAS